MSTKDHNTVENVDANEEGGVVTQIVVDGGTGWVIITLITLGLIVGVVAILVEPVYQFIHGVTE